MHNYFSDQDKIQLDNKNISIIDVENQISSFEKGFPFLEITSIATVGKGVAQLNDSLKAELVELWNEYCNGNGTVVKFVPASGAASRMFKDVFAFLDGDGRLPESGFMRTFFDNIDRFAFYNDLDAKCQSNFNKNVESLLVGGDCKAIIEALLGADGLNYGNLPKGLLKFHAYSEGSRTPVEEHLEEGNLYAKTGGKSVNVHLTVSPEHRALFEALVASVKPLYEKKHGVVLVVNFSEQKSQTDTLAVNEDNTPFREDGKLLFRPGGHGALIENLNDLDADVVFVKNIDNVVPDRLKGDECLYKQALAGYLIKVQKQCFEYLELLDSGEYTREDLLGILHFLQDVINVKNPDTKYLEDAELVLYLKSKLNRPVRVCGMVRNIGEPGGGPFFAVNKDKTVSLQILESSQIDLDNPEKKAMFESGTHFNPVDLVCGLKNYKGDKFDLRKYIDLDTGFISKKSKSGKNLKALELPGLWNGAMSDWNTIFVEVPLSTFNPVKTVNDLLRKEHQQV
ncbi:DUF4301 family protein [Dysgonomonas capnocytophagoides]|uniref:DUF4301 family protein n=1 Tax=Dysgonomonas capnocytophagoides TaxID=45254 RepID=A0A4Y8L570_9BACT|nr:DUF4301 family protein [Dysgonomonas capnocytophagoides]TFD97238.1 DUF4301 family protein [Dysgonomonas capnocytophagoides]